MSEILSSTKAFIIGPIGDRDAPAGTPDRTAYEEAIQVLEEIIWPACSSLGIECIRADQISRTGEIPEQVFRQLRDAQIVIADLTGANPNVMYELGLRHTTGKLTIQIGERGRLPFDIATIRTILFRRTEGGLIDARRKLTQLLATGIDSGGDPVTATRIWHETLTEPAFISEQPNENSPDDAPGFLELLADVEERFSSLIASLGNTTTTTQEITRIFHTASEQFSALNDRGASPSERLSTANRTAARLEEPASRLEVYVGDYSQSIVRLDPGMQYLFDVLVLDESKTEDALIFIQNVKTMIDAVEAALEGTIQFKESLGPIGSATRSLNGIARRISATLQSMIDSSNRIIAWKSRIEAI